MRDLYIKDMNQIYASEELISRTITNIKNYNKIKNGSKAKKIVAATAAAITISVGSVGAYISVTGNTEILEKLGINISKKYEEHEQVITDENGVKNQFTTQGIQATLKSAAVDSTNLVLQIDLKTDLNLDIDKFSLKTKLIELYKPSQGIYYTTKEELGFEEYDAIGKIEGGYRIFKYYSIEAYELALNTVWDDMFYSDDTIKCSIEYEGFFENGKIIDNQISESPCKFHFSLNKPENLEIHDLAEYTQEDFKKISYNNVNISIGPVIRNKFANAISLYIVEDNIDIDSINDIQRINIRVKDSSGNEIKIISKKDIIGTSEYKDGKCTSIFIETNLVIDNNSNDDYTYEVYLEDKPKISVEEIQKRNKDYIEYFKTGEFALKSNGVSILIDDEDIDNCYVDEYGVYRYK